jgi:hypothetical protein
MNPPIVRNDVDPIAIAPDPAHVRPASVEENTSPYEFATATSIGPSDSNVIVVSFQVAPWPMGNDDHAPASNNCTDNVDLTKAAQPPAPYATAIEPSLRMITFDAAPEGDGSGTDDHAPPLERHHAPDV